MPLALTLRFDDAIIVDYAGEQLVIRAQVVQCEHDSGGQKRVKLLLDGPKTFAISTERRPR